MIPAGMQWRAIENALKSVVKEATGLETVWAFGKGAQPNRPYVRMQWLSWDNVADSGYVEEFNAQTGKVEKSYYASRTGLVDVQCITDDLRADSNSASFADALMIALDMPDIASKWLAPVGVAVATFSGARPLDAVEDGNHPVSRTSFTLNLNIAVNVSSAFTVGPIDTVQASGTIEGGAKPDEGGDITVTGD